MEYAEEKEFTSFEEETTSASDAEESRMLNSLDAGTDGLETSPPRSLLGLEQLRDRARMHVQEYIRTIPAGRKLAYMEAVTKAPNLVATETDAMQFVRHCKYNIAAASERLILYWTTRKQVFGANGAFLPLSMTGYGALTENDVLQLKAGFPAWLPNTTGGLHVAYADRRQHLPSCDAEARLRCTFYLAHLASKDSLTQTDGVLVLVLLNNKRVMGFDLDYARKSSHLLRHVLPIKFRHHILNFMPTTMTRRYTAQNIITNYLSELLNIGFGPSDTRVHFERENGQILRELMELGLTKEGIPTDLGGSWTFDMFSDWCRQQVAAERLESLRAGTGMFPATMAFPADEQSRLTQVRMTNAIHSRRKRDRRRNEEAELKEEHAKLEAEHASLEAEHKRLRNLLEQANEVLGEI